MESFESYEELSQRLYSLVNDEEKVMELQSLITAQRKTITFLSKTNSELLQIV